MESAYWIKYSDYKRIRDERNMECIIPADNAVPVAYDLQAGLGRNCADLIAIVLDDKDESERNMRFVRRFGLLGLALEEDNFLTLPDDKMDMSSAVFCVTGRSEEKYARVFSASYYEKEANISAWLDWIAVRFNRAQVVRNGRLTAEPFAPLTLQTMLESAVSGYLAENALKVCRACGKIFYSEDQTAMTCSELCKIQYENMEHLKRLKDALYMKPISGG